jgi:hypothetical protein
MKAPLLSGLLVLLITLPAPAQLLSVTVLPNPAPLGAPITVSASDAYGLGLGTSSGCLFTSVHAYAPGGPMVEAFVCIQIPLPIPACGQTPRTQTWAQTSMGGGMVGPGQYWFPIAYGGPTGMRTEWFSVTIVASPSAAPTLGVQTPPQIGTTFMMGIIAPNHPGDAYYAAISGSTNAGFAISPVLHFSLDMDALFALSFPNPPLGLFANFQGNLDNLGQATNLAIALPNLPALSCLPLHVQALVVPATAIPTILQTTNELAVIIQ